MDKLRKKHDEKIISFIPDGEFYYNKAIQAMQRDRFEDAQRYLKRASELSPEDSKILMEYGVLVMEEGRFEEAHELLMTANSLAPIGRGNYILFGGSACPSRYATGCEDVCGKIYIN